MKVKYVGIKLKSDCAAISSEEFYEELESISGLIVESPSAERHFYFDNTTRDGYLLGLVVTLKDQRRFCKASLDDGELTLKTEDLIGDDKLVDFNFLAIRKDTRKGVYQYYHNSCSANVFGDVCKKIFYNKKELLIHDEYLVLAPGEAAYDNSKQYKKAQKKYAGRPKFAILIDSREVDQIIRSYRKVKELDVTFEAVESPTDAAIAARQLSDSVSLKYRIGVVEDVENIAQAARQLCNTLGFLRGKAVAEDEFGEERIINLINCPHDFGQEDFDELAYRVDELKASEFCDNDILDDLISILEKPENAPIFAVDN
ncbi:MULTISPECIES: hypothetical protein [unclassified Halomonas]|uniref:hypothetical protein n=1 Tax=unclassified Halomonas TaxID=2609666 RepID=UPI001EF54CB3|nr:MULTISPECIES: hypothetical protein [unclassified Halomonas]MCG7576492.1 hypothetical protein [Halomonas sp. MMH1-48]MCG7603555.1 hypothetical protein [Halomonas sp. MM17-34]MCG7612973.1 hypothetical protein [Halomonas sp. MM17-29]MCG7619406.1 hypothetical protein [Halomonas sp. DSH1-27]